MRELLARLPEQKSLLRIVATLTGLLALWLGCDLTNRPLNMGGPMNLALNPVGIPLVVLGVLGVALVPARGWVVVWPLAAVLTIAMAGANLWAGIPIEESAFQTLRTGVPDPVSWPAPAYLHALAFAPVGVAVAALLPGSGALLRCCWARRWRRSGPASGWRRSRTRYCSTRSRWDSFLGQSSHPSCW